MNGILETNVKKLFINSKIWFSIIIFSCANLILIIIEELIIVLIQTSKYLILNFKNGREKRGLRYISSFVLLRVE